jgi:hypothetical protein
MRSPACPVALLTASCPRRTEPPWPILWPIPRASSRAAPPDRPARSSGGRSGSSTPCSPPGRSGRRGGSPMRWPPPGTRPASPRRPNGAGGGAGPMRSRAAMVRRNMAGASSS